MSAAAYNSPDAYTIYGEARSPSTLLQSVRPSYQKNGLIGAVENSGLPADLQDGQPPNVELCDVESETHVFDSFDDEGSLFGDYISSKGGSIEYSSVAESSFVLEGIESQTPESSISSAVLLDPDVPLPSVERDLPSSSYYHTFRISPVKKAAPEPLTGPGLFTLDQKNSEACSNPSLQNLAGNAQNGTSVPKRNRSQTNNSSTSLSYRKSLPLCIALALATSETSNSVVDTIKAARSRLLATQGDSSRLRPTSTHQIPIHLESLLDGLHRKFNQDQSFRTSTVTWLLSKMAFSGKFTPSIYIVSNNQLISSSAGTKDDAGQGDFANGYLSEAEMTKSQPDLLQALFCERLDHEQTKKTQDNTITCLRHNLNQATNDARHWKELFNEATAQLGAAVFEKTRLAAKHLAAEIDDFGQRSSFYSMSVPTLTDSSVDTTYFICRLPLKDQPDEECGGLNDTPRMDRGKMTARRVCKKCHGNITSPAHRESITEAEFVNAGGRISKEAEEKNEMKRKISTADEAATPKSKRSCSASASSTANFGRDLDTASLAIDHVSNPIASADGGSQFPGQSPHGRLGGLSMRRASPLNQTITESAHRLPAAEQLLPQAPELDYDPDLPTFPPT